MVKWSFKPCYKWNTFNTSGQDAGYISTEYKCFKPCYKWNTFNTSGQDAGYISTEYKCFKPCYKWNTFNTEKIKSCLEE